MENTIDIRSYILTNTEDESVADEKKVKTKPIAEYNTIFASGTDFIVQKKTPRSMTSLVLIVSQKQYYIKNEKNGEIKILTPELLAKFTDGNDVSVEGVNWIQKIPAGIPAARSICGFLSFGEYFKDNILFFDDYLVKSFEYEQNYLSRKLIDYYKVILRIRKEFPDITLPDFSRDLINSYRHSYYEDDTENNRVRYLVENIEYLKIIELNYGISGVDNLIHEFHEAADLVRFADYRFKEILKEYEFKCELFIDYIIHESMRQGFVGNSIVGHWYDALNMQKNIYGKITDKYPEHLDSLHTKLSYITRVRTRKYDKERWLMAVANAKELEHTNQFYCVTVPKTREELCDEATQQSNCVAGYFNKMLEGKCTILFLRNRKTPEKSWITIEVQDDAIVQAKLARNRNLTPDAHSMLSQYAEVKNLKMRI